MRTTIYKCDQCKKEIGDNKHITMSFHAGIGSGISIPPRMEISTTTYWRVVENLSGKFIQFCSVKCLTVYFTNIFKKSK